MHFFVPLADGGGGGEVTIVDFEALEHKWARERGLADDDSDDDEEGQDDDDDEDDDDDDDDDDEDDEDDDDDDDGDDDISGEGDAPASSAAAAGAADPLGAFPDGDDMRGAGRILAVIHKYQTAAQDVVNAGYDDDSFIDDELALREAEQRRSAKAKTLFAGYFVHKGGGPIELAEEEEDEDDDEDDGDDDEHDDDGSRADGAATVRMSATQLRKDNADHSARQFIAAHAAAATPLPSPAAEQALQKLAGAAKAVAARRRTGRMVVWPYELDGAVLGVDAAAAAAASSPAFTEGNPFVARLVEATTMGPVKVRRHLRRLRAQRERDAELARMDAALGPLRVAVKACLAKTPPQQMQRNAVEAKKAAKARLIAREAAKEAKEGSRPPLSKAALAALAADEPEPSASSVRWFAMDGAVKRAVVEYMSHVRAAIDREREWRGLLNKQDRDNEARKAADAEGNAASSSSSASSSSATAAAAAAASAAGPSASGPASSAAEEALAAAATSAAGAGKKAAQGTKAARGNRFLPEAFNEKLFVRQSIKAALDAFPADSINSSDLRSVERSELSKAATAKAAQSPAAAPGKGGAGASDGPTGPLVAAFSTAAAKAKEAAKPVATGPPVLASPDDTSAWAPRPAAPWAWLAKDAAFAAPPKDKAGSRR
ncbi:hypothetical protein FNF31_00100 [Cafeteria roenbergensis]|uniref:Uncharacterized protein n=1 Tax=Cafeteria roenbergensis TaxID=33653 RepID=A0A5A8DHC5_CAFRO|nr:hypothetical protein FNF28_03647 [Cafeteria roenbergensis]KAA0168939.1 hypothetical protein FNF31_00100 [Cafeteria roenbergensis]